MIDELSLLSFSRFFPDKRQLEKDYLINLMLKIISINKISNIIEFKGGTALYLFHGLDRFSEDLDFSCISDKRELAENIDALFKPVINDFNLSYKISKNKGNKLAKGNDGKLSGIRTELFVEGPLFKSTNTRHKIKIDISVREDIIMKSESARMISRYNDIGQINLYKMPLEEILAEKLAAIIACDTARDLYDAYFILKYLPVNYNWEMFLKKIKKRRENYNKTDLINSIDSRTEAKWKEELSYLLKDPPGLDEVKNLIKSKIK